jgi:hypothetical protein
VSGETPAPIDMPTASHQVKDLEQGIASALLQADEHAEIKAISRFSERAAGAIPFGVQVDFHDGAKAFVNGLAMVRAGKSSPGGRWYEVPATV